MSLFIRRYFIFITPCLLYLLISYVIDPYNFINPSSPVKSELKKSTAYRLHYPLWKLTKYTSSPKENILLGDSRTNGLKTKTIQEISGIELAGMGYGGASLQEIIDTFWLISHDHHLKNVYIGLNFNLYNKLNNRNRVQEAKAISKNYFSYAFSKYCFDASVQIIKALLTNSTPKLEEPDMTKEEFWEYQLDVGASNYYNAYVYPDNYFNELKSIAGYCQSNDIKLTIFIHPSHDDLQAKVQEFGLEKEQAKFKQDLKLLGVELYDFDYPSPLTSNKNEYLDPFHYDEKVAKIVIDEVFNKRTVYAKKH